MLALDHGDQRIGLALTDREQRHALAHGTVAAQPEHEALRAIVNIISSEGVTHIVVGLPLTLEGAEGFQAEKARTFGTALARETGLPVSFVDERFTSGAATKAAKEKGGEPDAEAARLILEAWLMRRTGSSALLRTLA